MVNLKNQLSFYFLISYILVLQINGQVVPYLSDAGITSLNSYSGGVYSETQNIIYFVPHSQGNETNWHFVNCSTGEVVPYAHSSNAVQFAYSGGFHSPTQNRIFFAPYAQATESQWHYIDCSTGQVVSYYHYVSPVKFAYSGGVHSHELNRCYFVPYSQANQSQWHYIECGSGIISSYTHNTNAVHNAYSGGVHSPTQQRIYFVPYSQASETDWHFVNCSSGNVVSYVHNSSAVQYAYFGGVHSPGQNRIYFAPYSQATESEWHFIDCSTGEVVPYAHNSNAIRNAYSGGVYSPTQQRIYLVPYSQATETSWHFIDCSTGDVVSYVHNSNAVQFAYYGGVHSPEQNRTYLVPFDQAKEANWHYIVDFEDSILTSNSYLQSTEMIIDSVTSQNLNQESSMIDRHSSFPVTFKTHTSLHDSFDTQISNQDTFTTHYSIQDSPSPDISIQASPSPGTSIKDHLSTHSSNLNFSSLNTSIQDLISTQKDNPSLAANSSQASRTTYSVKNNEDNFNLIITIEDLVFLQLRSRNFKHVNIFFKNELDFSSIEQAVLQSIGNVSTLNITSEGNDEYSINIDAKLDTSLKKELSLDSFIKEIVNNLKRDEEKINVVSKREGFDLTIEYSRAIIYATEILNNDEKPIKMICEKFVGSDILTCVKGTFENNTFIIDSSEQIDLDSGSSTLSEKIKMYLFFFQVTFCFIFR